MNAKNTTIPEPVESVVQPQDVYSVGSRVSWSAVLAGSVVAVTISLMLTIFASALGLTLADQGVKTSTAAIIGVVAAVFAAAVGLFVGGATTTRLAVGENRCEAGIHGLLTWATVTVLTAGLVGMGVKGGYNTMLAGVYSGSQVRQSQVEEAARSVGVPQERIDQVKEQANQTADQARQKAEEVKSDPVKREEVANAARDAGQVVGWGTLLGMLLTLGTAMAGALWGAGPEFRFANLFASPRTVTRVQS